MKSYNFKSSLLRFLANQWRNQAYLLSKDIMYILGLKTRHIAFVHDNIVRRNRVDEPVCIHEEADTRLIWHAKHICEIILDENIIICANDIDVLIILQTHAQALPAHIYEDISLLARNMRPTLCTVIAGFHAFTRSDCTASFLNKGKVRPLALMDKSVKSNSWQHSES